MIIHFSNNIKFLFGDNYKKFPMLLSRACIDPNSDYQKKQLFTMMILDQVLMMSYNIISIYGNISLYIFLRSQQSRKIVLNETDQKKQRKRNLVPAYHGIVHMVVLIVNYLGIFNFTVSVLIFKRK